MDDGFENIEEYNPNKNIKYWLLLIIWLLIWLVIKKVNPAVTELFIRVRKLNICFVFITQPYFAVPKSRLNYTHYLIMEIPKKRELQQTVFKYPSNIDSRSFMNLYKKCISKPYSSLVIDTTVA